MNIINQKDEQRKGNHKTAAQRQAPRLLNTLMISCCLIPRAAASIGCIQAGSYPSMRPA